MRPIHFAQSNGTLGGGPAHEYNTGDDVLDLPVHRDGQQIISCWRVGWLDRLAILVTGRVWLRVLADRTHHPVALDGRSPFAEPAP